MIKSALFQVDLLAVMACSTSNVDFCSLKSLIVGVTFYSGATAGRIAPKMEVKLVREESNRYDCNAVLAICVCTKKVLGHLDKSTAAIIAPIIDRNLSGFKVKAEVHLIDLYYN